MEAKLVEVLDALMKAAGQIGMEGVRLWPQMVGITFVKSVFWALVHVAFVALTIWLASKAHLSLMALAKKDGDSDDAIMSFLFIGWIVVVFVCAVSLKDLDNDIAGMLYPEARTVLELAAKIK